MVVICLTVRQAAKQFSKNGCTILHFPHTLLEVMENGKAVTLKNEISKYFRFIAVLSTLIH